MSNITYMQNLVSNLDRKSIGFWIRPDAHINGLCYDKLYLSNLSVGNMLNWHTVSTDLCYVELSSNIYSLTYEDDLHLWTAELSDQIHSLSNTIVSKYMRKDLNSMLEDYRGYSISWTKINDIDELLFDNYDSKDVVWRLQKYWTHDILYASSDTIEETIWLDKYNELSDGTHLWYKTGIKYYKPEGQSKWIPITAVTDMISRPQASLPYQTSLWQISATTYIEYPIRLAALHNTKHLCLFYYNTNKFDIWYIIADAVPRKQYDAIKMKNREWNLYNEYTLSNQTELINTDLSILQASLH